MTRTILILAFALSIPAHAEVLSLPTPEGNQATVDRSVLPRRGTSMNSVRASHGEPVSISGPVGDPPITRWNYDGFSVFFEYQHVINAVIPGKPAPIYHQDELRPAGAGSPQD